MTITYGQMMIFIILAILGMFIYMLIYRKRGQDNSLGGYFQALTNCFRLTIISIFIILGTFLIKVCLTQPLYVGLIVPIGWFFIAYNLIKRILNMDFGLSIHIINPELRLLNILKENLHLLIIGVILIGFIIFTFIIFFIALPDVENQPNGPIPVLLAGIAFLSMSIGMGIYLYSQFNFIKIEFIAVFIKVFVVFIGILLLRWGLETNNEYKSILKEYREIEGKFIGEQVYSTDDNNNDTYFLIYSYEVDGNTYEISTNYGTSFIPKEGTEKTILYNPDDPEEAIIKGNNSILCSILGIVCILMPIAMLMIKKLRNLNSNILNVILDNAKKILLGAILVGIAAGIYYFICIGSNDFSMETAIQTGGVIIICPLLFFIAGIIIIINKIYFIIKIIFLRNNKNINNE